LKQKEFSRKICMASFLGRCLGKILKAHTLSKQKSINPILEGGSFYVRGYNNSTEIEKAGPKYRVGINNVSVFYGFCGKHDKELFSVFEDDEISLLNEKKLKKQLGLMMFRTLCKELYLKQGLSSLYSKSEDYMDRSLDSIPEREKNRDLLLEGSLLAIKDLRSAIKNLQGKIKNENYNNIRYVLIEIPYVIDVSFDSAFIPDIDKQNELERKNFELFAYTTLFENNKTYICFIWNKDSFICEDFIRSVEEARNLKNFIYSFVFCEARELIIRASWWEAFSPETRKEIESKNFYEHFGSWSKRDIIYRSNIT